MVDTTTVSELLQLPIPPVLSSTFDAGISTLNPLMVIAHKNRLALSESMTEGKGTEDAYGRHLKDYEAFWDRFQREQLKENEGHTTIPAHPIVGEKVAIFLEYELTRPKVCSICPIFIVN